MRVVVFYSVFPPTNVFDTVSIPPEFPEKNLPNMFQNPPAGIITFPNVKSSNCCSLFFSKFHSSNKLEYSSDNFFYEIEVFPGVFEEFCSFLESKGYSIEAELDLLPQNTVKIKEKQAESLLNLLNLLEEHEDVQKVYTNLEILK